MRPIDADALITFFEGARKMLDPSDYKTADEFNTRDLMLLNVIQVIRSFPEVKAVPVEDILEKTYADFINSGGGEGWLKIDGKEYFTDVGYAIEGIDIFMKVFKRRLAESER